MAEGPDLRRAIVDKLAARAETSSICPSEVARDLSGDDWRDLMEPVRQAAGQLVEPGVVVITQGDQTVDLATVTGPIRIRRGPQWSGDNG